jgi:hypothetical protein
MDFPTYRAIRRPALIVTLCRINTTHGQNQAITMSLFAMIVMRLPIVFGALKLRVLAL